MHTLSLAGATALVKLGTPSADELGLAKHLSLTEIGGTKCIVLQQVGCIERCRVGEEGWGWEQGWAQVEARWGGVRGMGGLHCGALGL